MFTGELEEQLLRAHDKHYHVGLEFSTAWGTEPRKVNIEVDDYSSDGLYMYAGCPDREYGVLLTDLPARLKAMLDELDRHTTDRERVLT